MDFQNHVFSDALERVKKSQGQLLQILSSIKTNSKEELIQRDYIDQINKSAPWLSIKNLSVIGSQENILRPVISTSASNQNLDQVLNQTQANPDQRMKILSTFLERFKELSDQDRNVLLDNFKTMEIKDLKKELEQLLNMFS